MQIHVGTSGWSNPIWNPNGLEWYVNNSGLNAVELNMSFYHLPHKYQIEEWAEIGKKLLWTVKVNRSITHFFRFNNTAVEKMVEFLELFSSLDHITHYYLFQLPPNAHPNIKNDIENFFKKFKNHKKFALEWKNQRWFSAENMKWAKDLGITIISADAPLVPRDIICTNETVYLRLHGRSDWFEHHYSRKELSNIVKRVIQTKCKRVIALLNNQTSQLKNAQALMYILKNEAAIE
jgi:uncharacterized protein YecE (DUF72 family)